MQKRKLGALLLALVTALTVLASCGGDDANDDASDASADSGTATETVKVGLGPYYDFTLFEVASKLHLDRKLGIELQIDNFPAVPTTQLRRGDIDVGYSAPTAGFPVYEQFPEYRDFMIANQFKGFTLVGRPGEVKPYDEYLDEAGGDDAAAKREFVSNELPGKSFCVVKELTIATLSGMFELGDVSVDDVTITDFADQAKAANAFIRGECDFYTGAVPQIARLLYSEDFKGKFVVAAPHEAFGPGKEGVLFFSTFATTSDWLEKNPETAKKLVAMWFRATRYLKERPEQTAPIVAEAVRATTGGLFDDKTTRSVMSELLVFPTFEEAESLYFDPDAPTNYFKSVNDLFKNAVKEGQVPGNLKAEEFQATEETFDALRADKKLVAYIKSPLE